MKKKINNDLPCQPIKLKTTITSLGKANIDSPLLGTSYLGTDVALPWDSFSDDSCRILVDISYSAFQTHVKNNTLPRSFEEAGPRRRIYFDPVKVRAGILTAGGLCPGINDVIRSLVMTMYYRYGVLNIMGLLHGFQGLSPKYGHALVPLTPESVADIHQFGGTILSSSRGAQDIPEMVDTLERLNFNMLFCVGGDGTMRGSQMLVEEIKKRNLKITVIGIPKTIDNDINMVSRSFGFETAVAMASEVIKSAHTEALGAPNGVGLVKLMGRDSGFIAATASLAQSQANYVLIPEIDFDLEGPNGLLDILEKRLAKRKHAVIVVAEGAGQKFFSNQNQFDASGNKLHHDIGQFLEIEINKYFKEKNKEINLKYIDPSYIIRSTPANSSDRVYCSFLGQNAVHAAMAGKTGLLIGLWNNIFVHVPMDIATSSRKKVDPNGSLWNSVLENTGQPSLKVKTDAKQPF